MYSRIAKVVSGMVFGTGQEVVFQLLSAFLWIKAWGAPLYGEWLMISLVPILLLRGNAGVFHAATSDLIRYRQGDDKVRFGQALADLIRSERLFLVAMALLYGSMAATASFLDSFAYFSIGDLWIAAGLFFLQFLLYQRQQSILCLAKAGERAPEAIIWQNQFRLAFIVSMLALPALLDPILCLTAAVAAQLAVAISTAARFHALISEASELRAASSGSNALDMTKKWSSLFNVSARAHRCSYAVGLGRRRVLQSCCRRRFSQHAHDCENPGPASKGWRNGRKTRALESVCKAGGRRAPTL